MSRDTDDREWDDRRRQPDDDYRPPRHRYDDERDDYDDEQFTSTDVRQRVVAPGVALMIVGILGIVGSLAMAAIFAFMLIEESKRGAGGPNGAITAVIFVGLSGLSLAACVVIAIGGARMRQCRNYALAMTAAILPIASFVLCGLLSVVIIPFGIWALVVLSNSEVKREFKRTRLPRDPDADDYSD